MFLSQKGLKIEGILRKKRPIMEVIFSGKIV
jgi:hypothetical protein